jgi:hypothetical protein
MRLVLLAALLAVPLAGCQTPEQSLASAENICVQSGFRPGTKSYQNCVNGNYAANRQASQQTADAVAAGAAAGLVGGAVVAASTPGYYYGPGPYYGPAWGPRYYGYGGYYRPYGWCRGYGCY